MVLSFSKSWIVLDLDHVAISGFQCTLYFCLCLLSVRPILHICCEWLGRDLNNDEFYRVGDNVDALHRNACFTTEDERGFNENLTACNYNTKGWGVVNDSI